MRLFNYNYTGVCDVEENFRFYFKQLTNIAASLFKWENLPSTVDERFLMENLILGGRVCWTQFDSKIYALNGNVGGEPNVYYEPQFFIIANPILGSKEVRIRNKDGSDSIDGLEGILMGLTDVDHFIETNKNGGLYGLIYQTAGLLADNISSINCAQINSRAVVGYVADSEALANSAEEVLLDIYAGKPYKVMTQDIMDKIQAVPLAASGQSQTIVTLIEARRSIYQDFFNTIGIGYQGNSKRERVNTAEVGLMRGCLDISLSNMIKNLKADLEKVNELFGTDIKVEVSDEVFYDGSGNATLGEEETETEETEVKTEEVDEKNSEESVEILEEKGSAAEENKKDKEGEDE